MPETGESGSRNVEYTNDVRTCCYLFIYFFSKEGLIQLMKVVLKFISPFLNQYTFRVEISLTK
jgi:hypothetical protein